MYKFDYKLDSITAKKERIVWVVFMSILFFLLYGSSNQISFLTGPHNSILMDWEKNIPFLEPFIVPYMSSDIMFFIAFMLPYTRLELRILAARTLFIVSLSCVIFILFPLQSSFSKPEIEQFTFLFGMLKADLPYNQLPSLHISFSVILWFSMKEKIKNIYLKSFLFIWFVLICISTLFVYQHHFIDLPTGFLMGLLSLILINKNTNYYFISQFTTPRSLKMGMYYLIVSVIFVLISFNITFLKPLTIYMFISFFSVSIIYAFGLNNLLVRKKGTPNIFQWIIFFPYYLFYYISWFFLRKKIDLMTHVEDNVYFGRQPNTKEYKKIKEKGLNQIINLAMNQHFQKTDIPQIRLNFLDQTIQSPESLHNGVLLIERYKKDGVYLHCKLGMSRSVLLISSWLIYNGKSIEEVIEKLKKIRPNYIKSKYIEINLDIYIKYLKELKDK